MKVKNNWYIYLVLVIVIITYVFFMNNKNLVSETKLDEVKLKDEINEISKKSFAIMVEKEDGSGYEEVDEFPTDYEFNSELSGCIDIDGKSLENAITYNEGIVSLNVNSTAYCYLYFAANSGFGYQLIQNPTRGLNTTLEGGLYRYQGTSVDNYVCFGTTLKSACTNNNAAFMYQIIGITKDGMIKLIKKEAFNNIKMQWYSNNTNITWPNSTIYKNINGSYFLDHTTYVPNDWGDLISSVVWKFGDNNTISVTAEELYNIENSWIDTVDAKIGLMYAHDYYYAYQSGGLNCGPNSNDLSKCQKSWLQLNVCDSDPPANFEWTMSRFGLSTYYRAFSILSDGGVSVSDLVSNAAIRPVFYLVKSVKYVSGTGTSADPFMIS